MLTELLDGLLLDLNFWQRRSNITRTSVKIDLVFLQTGMSINVNSETKRYCYLWLVSFCTKNCFFFFMTKHFDFFHFRNSMIISTWRSLDGICICCNSSWKFNHIAWHAFNMSLNIKVDVTYGNFFMWQNLRYCTAWKWRWWHKNCRCREHDSVIGRSKK